MSDYHAATPIAGEAAEVVERKILSVKCPNPNCDEKLDITNISAGTKASCPKCSNVTWTPAFKEKWWQKAPIVVGGAVLSIFIGAASGFLGAISYDAYKETSVEQSEDSNEDN